MAHFHPNRKALPTGWSTDDYTTPAAFVAQLERYLGKRFELDPCARRSTAQAPRYYALAAGDDGLHLPWRGRVFLNPPYSNVLPWVRRAARLTSRGRCPLVAALLPCCLDTGWFHEWVVPYAEIHFVRGRLNFLIKGQVVTGNRNPSFVAIYRDTGQDLQKPIVYHSHVFDAHA